MSDNLRKKVLISEVETGFQRERKFKKCASLRLNVTPLNSNRQRSDSFSALEELLQCGICLERLSHPRMLPCQHTFCLTCLKTHVTAKNLRFGNKDDHASKSKFTMGNDIKTISCPVCQRVVPLTDGFDSLDKLPKNLYLESLLKVVAESPQSPKMVENFRCVNCQMVSVQQEQVCQHCVQIFCSVCWNEHLSQLQSNLSLLVKQLDESERRLKDKLDSFESRCDTLKEKIKKAAALKVDAVLREEKHVQSEASSIKREGGITSDILLDIISKLKKEIHVKANDDKNNQKVTTYMNLHRETSKILDQINNFGEARITFDPDTFRLEQISEGIYNDHEDDHQQQQHQIVTNPFENVDSMARHYKSKSFTPKLIWNKCPRPAGLGIPPWDDTKLYIAATDSHNVLILDINKFKLIERLSNPEMNCPSGIAFSPRKKQIFVSDKWNHCIHVFSSEGEYLKNFSGLKLRGPDGIAMGPNEELVVCDTGNDRILLVDPEFGEKLGVIGAQNRVTQLNFPTSVAVYGANIVVADSGNNRIKTYNLNGDLLQEFGSFGKNPGQFRSAEVVAVDPLGFILVGDAGNARVQVFKPDGALVKIFGSKSGFGWVSGIMVTPDLDIITSDNKIRLYGKKINQPRAFKQWMENTFPKRLLGYTGFRSFPEVEEFFTRIVLETIEFREKNGVFRKDFMHLLLQLRNRGALSDDGNIAKDKNKSGVITDDEIVAQCFIFFAAGFDTSSATMAFAVYELAKRPEIQQRIREEIRQVLMKHDGKLTYEAAKELVLIEKVVSETLRKYPILPIIPRKCTKTYQVPDTNVVIEKGTMVQIPIWGLHMNPEFYPNPDAFDPERFSDEEKAKRPDFAYLPFGDGPRICIGARFGMLQAKVGLVGLLKDYRYSFCEDTPEKLSFKPSVILLHSSKEIWLNVDKVY